MLYSLLYIHYITIFCLVFAPFFSLNIGGNSTCQSGLLWWRQGDAHTQPIWVTWKTHRKTHRKMVIPLRKIWMVYRIQWVYKQYWLVVQ